MYLRETETDRQQPVLLPHCPGAREANPFRSHGMASNPRIVRRAVWKGLDGVHDVGRHPGLTPLVWGHVSPDGACDLDLEQRLDLDVLTAA